MIMISEFLRSDIAADLSAALLHTLWQGLAVSVILYFALKTFPAKKSLWRYRSSVIAMFMIVMCWLGTFSILQYEPPLKTPNQAASPQTVDATAAGDTKPAETIALPTQNIPVTENTGFGIGQLIALWSVGVFVMLARMFTALAGTAKLRREAVDIEDSALVELFEKLCDRMNITQNIRFAATATLKNPGVIGFWRPVLLVPVSMLSELPVDYLQAMIAHELAHIRRYDYLVNFCQMVAEAIFFFNPTVWWINKQIRTEREVCCDFAGIETTGERVQYAKILFDSLCRASQAAPAPAIASFSDGSESSSTERVKRIIHPQHKPQMRIGWIKLTMLIAIASVTLLGLWKTADVAIAFAADILTPQERIDKIAELDKSYGKPAFDPDSSDYLTRENEVTVGGTIKTWDGKKVKNDAHMTIHSHGIISISPAFGRPDWFWDGDAGTFHRGCRSGAVYVSVSAPGYAPAIAGPFNLKPGEKKEDIALLLGKGYPASILVVDTETKKPIPDAELDVANKIHPSKYAHAKKIRTNRSGLAILERAGEVNVSLTVRAGGYQKKIFENKKLIRKGNLVLELPKADPAEGVVVSQITGQPVADAVIRIQKTLGKNSISYGRDSGEILTTTDKNGRFTLDQIPADAAYVLSVKAGGHAYAFTDEVRPGQKNIRVKLGDAIIIKGRLTGPLDKLPVMDGKPYVPYCCSFVRDDHSHAESGQRAFVTIDGDEGSFEVTNLWGTGVRIGMSHWNKYVKITDRAPAEITLDLNDPLTEDGTAYHKRKLILEFQTPEGMPTVTGNIRLNYMDPAHSHNTYKGKLVEIVNGKAEAEIVAPGKIAYSVADTAGYWFKEVSEVKVDGRRDPLVIKVAAVPAGMIFGQVYNADGSPAGNTMVSYNIIKRSPLLDEKTHFLGVDGKNSTSAREAETKYSIQPLPLGGVHRIIAHRKSSYVVSEPIEITEENPIRQVDLTFPEGVTLSGKILLPDGSAAQAVKYELHFDTSGGHSFSNQGSYTDSQGAFEIRNINPDAAGKYQLIITSDKNYRPVRMKLKAKDMAKPMTITLEKGAVVTGQIIDEDTGWPIPGVQVGAWYSFYQKDNSIYEQLKAEAKTDKNGRFRFSNMKQGRNYHLTVKQCKYDDPHVTGSQSNDAIVEVTPYKHSKLKPRKPDSGK